MIKAYKIIEENETSITYEYNSTLSWAIFGSLGLGILGVALNSYLPLMLCGVTMVVYLYIGVTEVSPINKELRQALKDGKLTMQGSKYSFKNPMRLTLEK